MAPGNWFATVAHPDIHGMRSSAFVLYEGQFRKLDFRDQSNPANHIHPCNLFSSLSPKSVSRDYSKLTFRV